jgi:hypothetical protein
MATWFLLTLSMSANSIFAQPTAFNHVRSAELEVRTLISDGYSRSLTFRQLVDSVEGLPCVVYVASAVKLSQGMRGALLHSFVGDAEMPVLRVLLKTNLARDEAIAVIGHELQHAVEALEGARAAGGLDLHAVFERLDDSAAKGARRYETEAAIGVTVKVRDELRKSAPPRGRRSGAAS